MIVDPGLLIMDAHLCQWAENKTGRQEGYAQQEQQNLYTHLNDTTEILYAETNPNHHCYRKMLWLIEACYGASVAVAAEALLTANEAGLLPGNALELARQMQIARISEYDASDAVNQFTFDDVPMWLDKDTRNGLIARLNAEKAVGKTTSTLWLGTQSFTITPDAGLQMLSALEVYASECYDKTAEHKAAIAALNDVDAIKSYDFTQGYPAHLEF